MANLIKRPPKWYFPANAEKQYTRELRALSRHLSKLIVEILMPKIPRMIGEVEEDTPKNDDFIEDLNAAISQIRIMIEPSIAKADLEAKKTGLEVAKYNQSQFSKLMDKVVGVDIFQSEPWLIDQLKLFSSQNSQLINNMVDEELLRVSGIVERGLQTGSRYKSIAEDITKSFGISERKANLIARDQTSKLNGSLTKLRQESLGVEEYEWSTTKDERVRKSHAVLQGVICRWDDPTLFRYKDETKWRKKSSIGGTETHPSGDVNCRCIGKAVLDDIELIR